MNYNNHLSLFPRERSLPGTYLADPQELFGCKQELFGLMDVNPIETNWGRKYWEWNYILNSLKELGLLDRQTRGLGTGVGKEPLSFYLSRLCGDVVATDLFGADVIWNEARCDGVDSLYDACSFEYEKERLTFYSADMRNIPEESESFDFIWSCGSLEHVPTLHDTYLSFREIYRLLKPGGYAVMTTEFCLSEPHYLLSGMNTMDQILVDTYLSKLRGLKLVGDMDLRYNWIAPAGATRPRRYLQSKQQTQFHSGYIPRDFIHMVGVSAITPIGFVLQKEVDSLTKWEEFLLPDSVRDFERGRKISDYKAVKKIFEPYLDGDKQASIQEKLIMAAHQISIVRNHHNELLENELERLLQILPIGSLQDFNVTQLAGFFSIEAASWKKAYEFLSLAALTPSAFPDDSVKMASLAIAVSQMLNKVEEAVKNFHRIVEDLLLRGYEIDFILSALRGNDPITEDLRESLSQEVRLISSALGT